MADGSQVEWWYIEESVRGTTPSTPAWIRFRNVTCNFTRTPNFFANDEIRGDRQKVNLDEGTRSAPGTATTYLYYGEHDALLEAALRGAWATDTPSAGIDQLKVGSTGKTFSFMKYHSDLDSGDEPYHIYTGVEINSLGLTINTDGYIMINLGFLGVDASDPATTAPAGSTYGSLGTIEPMKATTAVIEEGGASAAIITEFSPSLENGLEEQFSIGSSVSVETASGISDSTGSITARFLNSTLYSKFHDGTESSLDILTTDVAGNTIHIFQPRIKYTGGEVSTGAGNLLVTMPYQALRDTTAATNFYIERNPI